MAIPSPCPTSRKCNARSVPPAGALLGHSNTIHVAPATSHNALRAVSRDVLRRPISHNANPRTPSQGSPAVQPAAVTMAPADTPAPHRANHVSPASNSPPLVASASPSTGTAGSRSTLPNTAGSAMATSGIATTLSTIPVNETVPNTAAVTGAVASVAPSEPATDRITQPPPKVLRPQRSKAMTPVSATTDNQAPTCTTVHGSASRRIKAVTARIDPADTWRCRSRLPITSTASTAALVAAGGHPRSATYAVTAAVVTPNVTGRPNFRR